jgi:ribosomal-protein-serine acetyltransferase
MKPIPLSDGTYLRPLEESDAEELHALIEVNRAYLARWLPWASRQTPADTEEFIQRARKQQAANDGFQAAIVCDERIAGVVGYHSVDWDHRRTSIGYWLSEDQQGKGTMTAAVRALTDHALRDLELNRVEIRAAVDNRGSRAIAERLGFHREGTLRESERVGGRYLDTVVYATLAGDRMHQADPSA